MIDGVQVIPLQRIPDERGTVMHMLKRTDPHFIEFGEIYFSTVYRGVVKGWHLHEEMTLNYACFLGPDSYSLAIIPPGVWNGFKGMSDPYSIVANACTHPHDPARSRRLDPFDNEIPYDWSARQH